MNNEILTNEENIKSETKSLVINGNNAIISEEDYNFEIGNEKEIDGIHILVKLAKEGKMDPWNIDIVDVTDKYLTQVFKMKSYNLRLTGRTLLFAAILLRLKSNILENVSYQQFEDSVLEETDNFGYEDDEFDDNLDYQYEELPKNNVVSIDEVLERRTSVRLNRNRVVTLKDLIRQLKFYEELDKKRNLKEKLEKASQRRVKSYAKFTADDIINLAHDEYIEKSIMVLHQNLTKIFETEDKIELSTLTHLGMDKINAYIALLFLSANEDYTLIQEEFYGDLYVTKDQNTYKEPHK